MAITMSSPTFSFLQFTEQPFNCNDAEKPCLPMFELEDLQFQLIAEVDGADKDTFPIQPIHGSITLDCEVGLLSEENWTATWVKVETGVDANPDIYIGYFVYNIGNIWELINVNQCFGILIYSGGTNFGCMDTCFYKVDNECSPPTSVIDYSADSNMFGFNYTAVIPNRIRLELYLHSPTNAIEEKSYSKSNGSSVMLMQRIWKDYQVKTNYFPEEWLERFVVATAHPDVRITCAYSGLTQDPFIRTEKVDINWQEENIPFFQLAQGKTVLRLASVRANINSNCG